MPNGPLRRSEIVAAAVFTSVITGVIGLTGTIIQVSNQPDNPEKTYDCYTIQQQILTIYDANPAAVIPSTDKGLITACDINSYIENLKKIDPAQIEPAPEPSK